MIFRSIRKYIGKKSRYRDRDGSSFESAIVINSTTHSKGVHSEYEYISHIFGQRNVDWTFERQSLMDKFDKKYDVLDIRLSNGEKKSIYFDISRFFGKF
ncbi:MAG: hypothetical protein WAV05_17065 [Anaerolineales bacterium]